MTTLTVSMRHVTLATMISEFENDRHKIPDFNDYNLIEYILRKQ